MKDCPVCKRPDLADGLARCPQCNADLECFDLLDELQEKPAARVPLPSIPATPKMGWAAGSALVLLLLLVPLTAFVGNRYIGERVDRLENRLASTDSRTGPSSQEWSKLYGAVQTLTSRMGEMEQQLSGLTAEQAKIAAGARRERAKLEGGLSGMLERMSHVEAQVAALGQQLDVGRKGRQETMTELAAFFSQAAGKSGSTPQPGARSSPGGPSVAATPVRASAITDYHAAPVETLWRIARRFYGKGIYYPVLLEDNPGLAIHGPSDGRIIRIARQREHVQETYRRLVFSEGGRTLFRYRAKADDNWRSLARAFYGSERRARELEELNGTPNPETGRRVLIPLD